MDYHHAEAARRRAPRRHPNSRALQIEEDVEGMDGRMDCHRVEPGSASKETLPENKSLWRLGSSQHGREAFRHGRLANWYHVGTISRRPHSRPRQCYGIHHRAIYAVDLSSCKSRYTAQKRSCNSEGTASKRIGSRSAWAYGTGITGSNGSCNRPQEPPPYFRAHAAICVVTRQESQEMAGHDSN